MSRNPCGYPARKGVRRAWCSNNPMQMLERVGLALPKRIRELRVEVFANPDQLVDIKVELEDASPEAAQADAKSVSELMHDFFADVWVATSALKAITGTSSGASNNPTLETAPHLNLTPDEKVLGGMIHLTPSQAKTTLELLASAICRKPAKASNQRQISSHGTNLCSVCPLNSHLTA